MTIFILGGFLASRSDFEGWEKVLGVDVIYVDPCHEAFAKPKSGFWSFASSFNNWMKINYSKAVNPVLLGYSLGGRLAQHVILDQAYRWSAAVIISAHPGSDSFEAMQERTYRDKVWADKFLTDDWQQVIADWNAQPVFGGEPYPSERVERNYCRRILAEILEHWSVGKQDNLKGRMEMLDLPMFWCAGELDKKYADLYDSLKFKNAKSLVWIAANSSHRLPWQKQHSFLLLLKQFLFTLHRGDDDDSKHAGNMADDQTLSRH